MSTRRKLGLGIGGVYILGMVLIVVIFGAKRIDNPDFHPADEFKLLTWLDLPGPMDINKGVLYLIIATTLTLVTMLYVSKRMSSRTPNRMQVAVEWLYDGMKNKLVKDNMDDDMARKWFPLICTLFVFIWFSNMIGYLPLPVNSAETFNLFGKDIPAFQIYAATANVSIPLVLSLIVFFSYNIEGVRAKGLWGYFKSVAIPPGVSGGILFMIVPLEIMSQFLRLISLTVRLFANLLAGHMLIQFMSGGLAVLLGLEVLAWFTLPAGIAIFLFEVTLIATLQAFIFAILTCIYLGSAVSTDH
jgi:F-type H+-transporting ATPase subunit a